MNPAAAADYVDQAPVTNWPARILLVVLVLLVIAWALWAMRRGWVNRQRRQGWIPQPMEVPARSGELSAAVPGLFLGTASHGDWMDRIAVHDLGVRSRANLSWGPEGVWFERVGARSVFVPAGDVLGIRLDSGIAGTVKAKDSVIVLTWRLGEATVETGFRADVAEGHHAALDGLTGAFGVSAPGPTDGRQGDR